MSPEAIRVGVGLTTVLFLVGIAWCVPSTTAAVIAWVSSVPLLAVPVLLTHPGVLRFEALPVGLAWGLVILFPDHSPIGPLSAAERTCQRVVRPVSAGARGAYLDHTLADQAPTFIADLEALEPPNDLWRVVKRAQLLDLQSDPPQVGVGDATQRLVSWPWRVAVDHRLVPLRLRMDDASRARRLRRLERPGFDDMTRVTRYDFFFVQPMTARFESLKAREGGLLRWQDEAAALIDLNADVRPPNTAWTRVRDLIVETHELELASAVGEL